MEKCASELKKPTISLWEFNQAAKMGMRKVVAKIYRISVSESKNPHQPFGQGCNQALQNHRMHNSHIADRQPAHLTPDSASSTTYQIAHFQNSSSRKPSLVTEQETVMCLTVPLHVQPARATDRLI